MPEEFIPRDLEELAARAFKKADEAQDDIALLEDKFRELEERIEELE